MNILLFRERWDWKSDSEGGYPNQKVVFDPLTKIIYVNEGVTNINVKSDIYSAWKEWLKESPSAVIPAGQPIAISAIGGDQITDTQDLGTTFFLENGWRLQPRPAINNEAYTLTVIGNLYTREPGETPFLFAEGVSVSLVRSNIVDLITVEAASVAITEADIEAIASEVWSSLSADYNNDDTMGKLQNDIANISLSAGVTPADIVAEMDANSTSLAAILSSTSNIETTVNQISTDVTNIENILTASGGGLTTEQATQLRELYDVFGLDPTKPLVVTLDARTAGANISQSIATTASQTTVTRIP